MSLQEPLKGTTKRKTTAEDDEDNEIVNVDFDFFNLEDIDYHAIKHLLTQLFHSDAEHLELHTLTDLILSQNNVGSTIKVDGKESDPYAFLTAISLSKHKGNSAVGKLSSYLVGRAKSANNDALCSTLMQLLSDESGSNVGVLLGERLVNMPVVLIPHMLRFLLEELELASQSAPDDFKFTHFIIPTRTYFESDNDIDMDTGEQGPMKKKRGGNESKLQTFHPEDEVTQDFTDLVADYQFQHVVNRESDEFGADVRGRVILIEAQKFKNVVLPKMIEATTVSAGL